MQTISQIKLFIMQFNDLTIANNLSKSQKLFKYEELNNFNMYNSTI